MKKERKKSTFWQDFKAFISRGNIIDLAVGLVVGAAFTAIVNSLVLRPEEVNEAGEVIVEAITLNYGNLIMAILTFLIDAFVIFTILRIVRNAQRRMKESGEKLKEKFAKKGEAEEPAAEPAQEAAPAPEPPKPTTEELLAEIRDLLRAQNAKAEPAAPEEKAE